MKMENYYLGFRVQGSRFGGFMSAVLRRLVVNNKFPCTVNFIQVPYQQPWYLNPKA